MPTSLDCEPKWQGCTIRGLSRKHLSPDTEIHGLESEDQIPPYFWGDEVSTKRLPLPCSPALKTHRGYTESRQLIGTGDLETLITLKKEAMDLVTDIFNAVEDSSSSSFPPSSSVPASPVISTTTTPSSSKITTLHLSPSLLAWRSSQHSINNILPPKGKGLKRASAEILSLLGASKDWPETLVTNNVLFGCGMTNLLIGAFDPETLMSNYVTDMAFYYEHGYHYVFPELEGLVDHAVAHDRHALGTPAGFERRAAVGVGVGYIRGKISLEERFQNSLAGKSATVVSRRHFQVVSLFESSLVGMAAEAIVRGCYDPGAVMNDMVFSSPGTDVVDVGADLFNSEVMNSFLNTADLAGTGEVTEEGLRKTYDAVAHSEARMLTERWHEPLARMCATLYCWHMVNDRHMFLRKAVLGYPMARKGDGREKGSQREADFDEAFDENFRTTGFSRPLQGACSGGDGDCDVVVTFLTRTTSKRKRDPNLAQLPRQLWDCLVTNPLAYVRKGIVDGEREGQLEEALRIAMARMYTSGLVLDMCWLLAHASHHAWQVNYLFEAAMFGSLLDSGSLAGKLDRAEG